VDRVPQELYFSRLRERNAGLFNALQSGALAPAQREVRRDLQEFASRDLDAHIRTLVEACMDWDRTFGTPRKRVALRNHDQSPPFFELLKDLAADADAARRGVR
jgi:hypothetical protein